MPGDILNWLQNERIDLGLVYEIPIRSNLCPIASVFLSAIRRIARKWKVNVTSGYSFSPF